jgi:leucyl-tRNA synthetase
MGADTEKQLHRTVKKVSEDIEALRFNTAISQMMIFVNHLAALKSVPEEAFRGLLLVLSPFAPHLCEELFSQRGLQTAAAVAAGDASCLALAKWPGWDEELCVDQVVVVPVQVNGKVKARIELPRDADEGVARAAVLENQTIEKLLEGKALKKFIFVPGRICNLIVS